MPTPVVTYVVLVDTPTPGVSTVKAEFRSTNDQLLNSIKTTLNNDQTGLITGVSLTWSSYTDMTTIAVVFSGDAEAARNYVEKIIRGSVLDHIWLRTEPG